MDGMMDWGATGPPDVLPAGYGDYGNQPQPVPQRGDANIPSGYNVPGTGGPGPGWMTAGPGATPAYMSGDDDEKKKSIFQLQPREVRLPEGVFRQLPNGDVIVLVSPKWPAYAGKTVTQRTSPVTWAAITALIGPYKPPALSSLLDTITNVAKNAAPQKFSPSRASIPAAQLPQTVQPPPDTSMWWIAGGIAVAGILGLAVYSNRKKE